MGIRGFERGVQASAVRRELDASQSAVLALPDGVSAAVIGAPGTGKTTAMIELIADRIHNRGWSPDELLVLSPTRAAATLLRDRLAIRLAVPTLGPLARTTVSVAFQLVRDAALLAGLAPPQLLTGADQDQIIAALIAGDIEDGTGPAWPSHLDGGVRALRGFRTQLRDLMMRSVEYGLSPDDLASLGRRQGREEWVAAAGFITEYQHVVSLFRNRSFDSAELVGEAVGIVRDATGSAALGGMGSLRLILLDDAQEITQSALSLVSAFADRGVSVIAFGDPDISTGSFRGARPEVLGRLAHSLGLPSAESLTLHTVYRHGGAIREVVSSITGRIGASGAGTQRKAPARDDPAGSVTGVLATSAAEELAVIARRLRERHVLGGVAWSDMAVVVRSGSLVPKLARGLAALEVPTRMSSAGTALRDEYAVAALILVLELGLGRRELTPETAIEALTGPLGGLDAISLRRLTAALRHQELAGGGDRSGRVLLADSLAGPGALATIDTRVARRASRLAASLAAIRSEAAGGATIEELLWGLWHRSGLPEQWYEQSLGSGMVAEEANRNLDAVVALFAAATRFVERMPQFSAHDFLDGWAAADVPEDTLAPRAALEAVLIGTPASTIGQEFSVVVVAGLQENVWPDLRVRGSLLGADDLVGIVSGAGAVAGAQDARLAVMHDELRMFAQAVSRASGELLVTAVASEDTLPSPFLRLVTAVPQGDSETRPLSLRGVVGRLRRELVTTGSPEAAAALARLAATGVPGAAPAEWYGLAAPSTTHPRFDAGETDPVPVSPSRMKAFETCPLHWLIDQLGGSAGNLATGLGTLLHRAAEEVPDGSLDALWRSIQSRWSELSFESEWQSEVHKSVAREMAARLSSYLSDFAAAGGRLLNTELSFELPLGTALLRGTIDRVEQLADGTAVIVDLKTGKSEPTSAAAVADHPQLGAYQLAFASGAIEGIDETVPSGGAKLVILSSGTARKNYYDPQQPAFDEEQLAAFRQRVIDDAAGMAGSVFIAQLGSHCLDPRTPGSCRIHIVGAVSA